MSNTDTNIEQLLRIYGHLLQQQSTLPTPNPVTPTLTLAQLQTLSALMSGKILKFSLFRHVLNVSFDYDKQQRDAAANNATSSDNNRIS